MTRLLAPDMFGVMAIALMVTVILQLLSDIGLQQNVVRHARGDDPRFLDTVWVVQIARGFGLWLLALVASFGVYVANQAGWVAEQSVYATPVLPAVLAVSAFSAVIGGFQSTRMATAYRSFDQRRVVQIGLLSQLAALPCMWLIGISTHSVWALVVGGLIASLATVLLSHFWMAGHPNRLRYDPAALRELLRFGKWVFVSSALGVLAANGDRLLLGGFVTAQTMGLYAIALLFVGAVEGALNRMFSAVSLPAFSEVVRNEPGKLRDAHYKMRIPADLFVMFVCGALYAAGDLIIRALYDPRYWESGEMLCVLAFSLINVRYGVTQQIYLAAGEPRNLAIINIVRFVALYSLVPLAFHFGGTTYAIWAIAIHAWVTWPLVYWFNWRLGITNARAELVVLLALPAGYLAGRALKTLIA